MFGSMCICIYILIYLLIERWGGGFGNCFQVYVLFLIKMFANVYKKSLMNELSYIEACFFFHATYKLKTC